MVNRDQQIAAMIHTVRHGNEDCLLQLLQRSLIPAEFC